MQALRRFVGSENRIKQLRQSPTRQSHIYPKAGEYGSFCFFGHGRKEEAMKDNRFATNAGGVIKAPKPAKNQPKASVTKGGTGKDLRNGK